MNIQELSKADKYLLLGNLLKKFGPNADTGKALEIVQGPESLDEKLAAIFQLYRKQSTKNIGSSFNKIKRAAQKAESTAVREKRKRKKPISARIMRNRPRILIMDPHPEVTRFLTHSVLGDKYSFIHLSGGLDKAGHIEHYSPRVVILNQESPLSECSNISETIHARKPGIGIIILCTKAQYRQAGKMRLEYTRLLTKPLNLTLLADLIDEVIHVRQS
jgi:hypothetical protein